MRLSDLIQNEAMNDQGITTVLEVQTEVVLRIGVDGTTKVNEMIREEVGRVREMRRDRLIVELSKKDVEKGRRNGQGGLRRRK